MNCCGGLARFSSPTNQSVYFQTLRVNPAWLSGRSLRHLGATSQPHAPEECKWCTNETAARSILAQQMPAGAGKPDEDARQTVSRLQSRERAVFVLRQLIR